MDIIKKLQEIINEYQNKECEIIENYPAFVEGNVDRDREIENLHLRYGDKPISNCCNAECGRHSEFGYFYCIKCFDARKQGACEYEWKECEHGNLNYTDSTEREGDHFKNGTIFWGGVKYKILFCNDCGRVILENEKNQMWITISDMNEGGYRYATLRRIKWGGISDCPMDEIEQSEK